jgi:hypothetical protein
MLMMQNVWPTLLEELNRQLEHEQATNRQLVSRLYRKTGKILDASITESPQALGEGSNKVVE